MKLLKKGAEADLFETDKGEILKIRPPKSYRLEEIDQKLRSSRVRAEAANLLRAKKAGVNVPDVLRVDETKGSLLLRKIQGKPAKESLTEKTYPSIARKIGEQVALLHKANIVHGDLTTSNIIVEQCGDTFLIDFGLSSASPTVEDKAVDLHLFEETLASTHALYGKKMFSLFLKTYTEHYPQGKDVVSRLDALQKRGRYKGTD